MKFGRNQLYIQQWSKNKSKLHGCTRKVDVIEKGFYSFCIQFLSLWKIYWWAVTIWL